MCRSFRLVNAIIYDMQPQIPYPPSPKKSKTWLIVIIAIVSLMVILGISAVFIILALFSNHKDSFAEDLARLDAAIIAIDGVERAQSRAKTAGGGLGKEIILEVVGTPNQSPEKTQATFRAVIDIYQANQATEKGAFISFTQQHGSGTIGIERSYLFEFRGLDIPVVSLMAEVDAGASSALVQSVTSDNRFRCTAKYSANLQNLESLWHDSLTKQSGDCSQIKRIVTLETQQELSVYANESGVPVTDVPLNAILSLLPYVKTMAINEKPYAITMAGSTTTISSSDPATIKLIDFLRVVRDTTGSDPRVVSLGWTDKIARSLFFKDGRIDMESIDKHKSGHRDITMQLISLMN